MRSIIPASHVRAQASWCRQSNRACSTCFRLSSVVALRFHLEKQQACNIVRCKWHFFSRLYPGLPVGFHR